MPSHYPQDKDYSGLYSSLSSLLAPNIQVAYVNFFPAEGKQDRPRVVVQLDIQQENLLQIEDYQGICAILIRYFHEEGLNQSSIIIHDAYKTYYLNEANEIEAEYPSGKLLAEPIRNQDGQFIYLSELEKNSDNVGYFDAASCYEAYCNDDELMNGAYGYYGVEVFSTKFHVSDNDESVIYPKDTSLSEIENKLLIDMFNDSEDEPDTKIP